MPKRKRWRSRSACAKRSRRPDKTAALVTPDRALARRVVAALERWQVEVDDSGGDALADTSAGIFARLVAEAALGGLEPATLLALLKHPLLRLGAEAGAHARAIAALERAVLRGPRPRRGSAGLAHALANFKADARRAAPQRSARLRACRPNSTRPNGWSKNSRRRSPRWKRSATSRTACSRWRRRMPKRSRRSQAMARRLLPMPAPTAGNCSALSKPSRKVEASQTLELAVRPTIRTFSICSHRGAPSGAPKSAIRVCAFSACWKPGCRASTASCSGASTKAPGRRTPAAIRG